MPFPWPCRSATLQKPTLFLHLHPSLAPQANHSSAEPIQKKSLMSDGRNKDSKPSSDEASSAEPRMDDSAGTRRPYYECTFCKRGFSNAQALGGHMNLHRKRRTRERQSPATPSVMERTEDDYARNNSAFCPHPYEPFRGYTYLPSSSLSYNGSDVRMGTDSGLQAPYEMSLFGGEFCLGSSTHVDGPVAVPGEGRRQEVEDAELDLELRLGHQP
ncbi:hypothetical protein GW17_00041137 [Ensete ventricosum]|nr:hypothetical protein GW17_00041137 [Ensete ventricosum]